MSSSLSPKRAASQGVEARKSVESSRESGSTPWRTVGERTVMNGKDSQMAEKGETGREHLQGKANSAQPLEERDTWDPRW